MSILRINTWWNTIVPQVLGWIYFCMLTRIYFAMSNHSVQAVSFTSKADIAGYILFFISLLSVASFGHLLNDYCDIETDGAAGKTNGLSGFSVLQRRVIVVVPFIAGVASWLALNYYRDTNLFHRKAANFYFAAQLVALVLYSVRPFRLKERANWGVAADAFYGHLNPVLITLYTFNLSSLFGEWAHWVMMLVTWLCFIKGVRNILLHQVEDRKLDIAAGLNTTVARYGPWRIILFINDYLFPSEVIVLIFFTILVCMQIPPCFIPLLAFGIMAYLKFSGWKLGYADRRLLELKYTYFMNDYYEDWLPVFMLAFLCVFKPGFIIVLILHLALFPSFIIKLVKDIKAIRENFKLEEEY